MRKLSTGERTQDPVLQVFFLLKTTRPSNVSLGKPPGIFGKNKAWMHFKPTFSINQFIAATSFLRLFRTVRSRTGARDILMRRLSFVSFGQESPVEFSKMYLARFLADCSTAGQKMTRENFCRVTSGIDYLDVCVNAVEFAKPCDSRRRKRRPEFIRETDSVTRDQVSHICLRQK